MGWQSVLVVWVHGTLEISAIIIAGGAGLIVGNSILFPGTHKRIRSLQQGVKDELKLMIELVPVFIVADLLKGYITRYSTMPKAVSISILATSLSFIIWYFVIYPIRVSKRVQQAKK